jgi:hypothetical protein
MLFWYHLWRPLVTEGQNVIADGRKPLAGVGSEDASRLEQGPLGGS